MFDFCQQMTLNWKRYNINCHKMSCTRWAAVCYKWSYTVSDQNKTQSQPAVFHFRILHAFGGYPHPVMTPGDLAMCLSLSRREPLYQSLSISPPKPTPHPTQPTESLLGISLQSSHHTLFSHYPLFSSPPNFSSKPRSCFRRNGAGLNKKRVVFADAKGLALTTVRLFIPEPSSSDSASVMKPFPGKLQEQQSPSNKQQHYKLRLGFHQPMLDLKTFLARLQETGIQLESCNISEHFLTGKVCVSHVSVEKIIHVRVTFDSWRSHQDIPCTFLQQLSFAGSDINVFAFVLTLPRNMDRNKGVEFFVYCSPGPRATPYWDNNRGQNYRVCVEKDGSNMSQGNANCWTHTLSKHQPPSWPSKGSLSMLNSAQLPHLQKSLLV